MLFFHLFGYTFCIYKESKTIGDILCSIGVAERGSRVDILKPESVSMRVYLLSLYTRDRVNMDWDEWVSKMTDDEIAMWWDRTNEYTADPQCLNPCVEAISHMASELYKPTSDDREVQ